MNLKKKNNKVKLLSLLSAMLLVNPAYADIVDNNDAINKSGKQRMLTQRMLKDYTLVGMKNNFGDPESDLKEKVKLFDKTLDDLKKYNKEPQIAQSILKIEGEWASIKQILEQSPKKEEVADLQNKLENLLASCHATTELLVKASGQGESEIINLSGRQRMLSQRLASLYMLKVWGVDDPEFEMKLKETMDEFSKAHKVLKESELNTEEINSSLKKVGKLYMWFEVMGKSKSGRYVPSLISKSSDKILSEMNKVTDLYVKASK